MRAGNQKSSLGAQVKLDAPEFRSSDVPQARGGETIKRRRRVSHGKKRFFTRELEKEKKSGTGCSRFAFALFFSFFSLVHLPRRSPDV